MVFGRHKNKPIDLKLQDSNYRPSPNPNSLKPQPAIGSISAPTSQVSSPSSSIGRTFPPTQTPVSHPGPVLPPYPTSVRPLPQPPANQKPTIINNYYYVTQPGPGAPQATVQPSRQHQPHQPQQQQQPPHQPHNSQVIRNPKVSVSKPPFSSPSSHSHHNSASSLSNSYSPTKPHYSPRSQGHRAQSEMLVDLTRSQSNQSMNSHHSIHHKNSRQNSNDSLDIYSGPWLTRLDNQKPRLPDIELDDDLEQNPPLPLAVTTDLIKEISTIRYDSLTVHNQRLFSVFSAFNKDSINTDDLAYLLVNPGGKHFKMESVSKIFDTFASPNSAMELEFRGFIKMSRFLKGCYESFKFHDYDRSNRLQLDEFQKCLKFNDVVCPEQLVRRIFDNTPNLNLEAYILAVILIRKYQKGAQF